MVAVSRRRSISAASAACQSALSGPRVAVRYVSGDPSRLTLRGTSRRR